MTAAEALKEMRRGDQHEDQYDLLKPFADALEAALIEKDEAIKRLRLEKNDIADSRDAKDVRIAELQRLLKVNGEIIARLTDDGVLPHHWTCSNCGRENTEPRCACDFEVAP